MHDRNAQKRMLPGERHVWESGRDAVNEFDDSAIWGPENPLPDDIRAEEIDPGEAEQVSQRKAQDTSKKRS